MVLTAPPAAAMAYYCKKVLTKLMFLGITGAMCLCLLFTFSRGAWVGMVVAVIIFALYMDRRLLGILGAVMAAALIFMPSITSRLTYLFTSDYAEASAVGGRALRWVTGRLLLTESNPWTGFGLGRFGGAVAMNNKLLEETEEFSYFYMDNYYLKTMVEMGYIGIIIFLILLAGLLVWGLRAVYRSGSELAEGTDPLAGAAGNYKAIAAGIFSGLCGVLVHCYFENIFEEPYMMAYFWGLAAMLMYLGFFKEEKSFG
jgi:O-antigen ligase